MCDDHVFIAPDNRLLTMIPALRERGRWHELTESWRSRQDWPEPSRTFHGRDILAPLAAAIASRRARIEDIGPLANDVVPPALPDPIVSASTVRGQVAAIDTWGNLISNIDAGLLHGLVAPAAEVRGHRAPLVGTYGEAPAGALVAVVNSFGVIEIACNQGSAAQITGAKHGSEFLVAATTVRGSPLAKFRGAVPGAAQSISLD
jgi:S-adenosylmethionine hydrolase